MNFFQENLSKFYQKQLLERMLRCNETFEGKQILLSSNVTILKNNHFTNNTPIMSFFFNFGITHQVCLVEFFMTSANYRNCFEKSYRNYVRRRKKKVFSMIHLTVPGLQFIVESLSSNSRTKNIPDLILFVRLFPLYSSSEGFFGLL